MSCDICLYVSPNRYVYQSSLRIFSSVIICLINFIHRNSSSAWYSALSSPISVWSSHYHNLRQIPCWGTPVFSFHSKPQHNQRRKRRWINFPRTRCTKYWCVSHRREEWPPFRGWAASRRQKCSSRNTSACQCAPINTRGRKTNPDILKNCRRGWDWLENKPVARTFQRE